MKICLTQNPGSELLYPFPFNVNHSAVVGKGDINHFSIFDFIASEQTTEDIWRLKGQNCENLCLKVPYF